MFPFNKLALCGGAIAALALVPAASAAPPALQDLNPPPPAYYTCKPVGARTICTAERVEVKVAEPQPELVCGSGPDAWNIYDNGEAHQRLTRRYDADGNLLERVIHEVWLNAFWSNPLTGKTAPYTQRTTITDTLTVPGDFSSAVETTVGEIVQTDPVTHQKVLRSVGRTVIGADGNVEFRSGQQPFLDAFVNGDMSVFDGVCAALS
ncbi:MAG TPA: hypothetical protein VE570_11005 [Thermoleophilaceae bacterium]|nr:hypothetical protein [Thermoleophilaceae bacterium]